MVGLEATNSSVDWNKIVSDMMKILNLNGREMGECLGVGRATISKYLSNVRSPSVLVRQKLMDLAEENGLDLSLD